MTVRNGARLAGFMFLFYIATAMVQMNLFGKATAGKSIAAKMASVVAHAPEMRAAAVLSLITIFDAIILAVALYALTRDADRDLALLALACRVGEGVAGTIPTIGIVALLSIATGAVGAAPMDAAAANALGSFLIKLQGWSTGVGATLFAVGSTIFAWLFLRTRSIPAALAWLGLMASILVVITLPIDLIRPITGIASWIVWMPMLVFEITLGLWLLIKGVRPGRP